MSEQLNQLDSDYRNFNESELPIPFSNRILTPNLEIEEHDGKYIARLGARIKCGKSIIFYPCPSLSHNWLIHNNRIKPLPYDTPALLSKALSAIDPDDLKFSTVLSLYRDGLENIEVHISNSIFAKANTRAKNMVLDTSVPKLHARLYPYQEQGIAWMNNTLNSIEGLILADEMGLGKTLQIISLFLLNEPTNDSPALIVCPTSLIANWRREIHKFSPTLTIQIHRGPDRTGYYKDLMRSQIVITTYDTLVNDISIFRGVEWKFLICDEAQAAKNPGSKRRKALGQIQRRYSIPVTGTPMENTLVDLWSLGDLAVPGILGSLHEFTSRYPDTESGASDLSSFIDTIILKRQVKDVASDLPERTDIDIPIDLDDASRNEYIRIKNEVIAEYGAAGRLVAVGQLALFCAHPWLRQAVPQPIDFDTQDELDMNTPFPLVTEKVELCISLLHEAFLHKRKVLVFASFNHCAEILEKAATKLDMPSAYWNTINGSTPADDRQVIIDEYSNHSGPAVLVMNPRAAGAGLNITAATIVIHYTQNWNPALEMQASARAHRRGQAMPVTIYRLYYQGTVEETMVERSRWKRELGDLAVPLSTRDDEDFSNALSLSPTKEDILCPTNNIRKC